MTHLVPRILLGTTGSDVHSVANQLICKHLEDVGCLVHNLGVAAPVSEWVEALQTLEPDLVLCGSTNGDIEPLLGLLRTLRRLRFPLDRVVVGGNLRLGATGEDMSLEFRNYGVRVVRGCVSFDEIATEVLERTSWQKTMDAISV